MSITVKTRRPNSPDGGIVESGSSGDPFARVRRSSVFRDGGFDRWSAAKVGIAGMGTMGWRMAVETVRSGAAVKVADFDVGKVENIGTQCVEPGVAKVTTVVDECQAIRPGAATGWPCDIRHTGIRALQECDVLMDCTDDPDLAWDLTEISNGLGVPLLRCALDGSGQREFGRVLCSAGQESLACQLCSYSQDDLRTAHPRQSCPGVQSDERPPTLAGGAMAAAIAGLGLIQAQRLVTGHDTHLVLEREILVDWNDFQIIPLRLTRSAECLSGHFRWTLTEINASARELRVAELLRFAEQMLGVSPGRATVAGYLHPLNTRAVCHCGENVLAVGTDWCAPPVCRSCQLSMRWLSVTQTPVVDRSLAEQLGILDRTLDSLGYPAQGAMFLARAPDKPTLRLLME